MSDPPLLSYDKPSWASPPRHQSSLTVLRQGIVLSELRCIPPDEAAQLSSLPEANGSHPLSISSSSKPITVGRLPFNRIPLDHPSVSRYHACLQFNADGDLFVYDLGSAHGTRLNNVTNPLPPRQFIPVPPGSFLQFGESSCRMIYERLDEDRTKELAEALLIEEAEERRRLASKRERSEHKDTASASDDRRRQEQQQSASTSFSDENPMQSLAKWLRQSGYDPDDDLQVVDEPADGRISISVILPVLDRETGEPITGQASANNRKEAERLAALDTCRQLDRLGLWNAAAAAGKRAKRQRKLRNVGYDEDEDDLFYDETAKRTERETNAPISSKTAIGKSETHESLLVKHKHLEQTIQDKESEMAVVLSKQVAGGNADDELEAFMGALDSELKEKQIAAMQVEITAMRRELQRLEQLIEFTKPLTITTGTAGRSEPIKVATSETPVESPVAAAKKSQPRTEFIKHLSPQMPSPSPPKQETAISSSNKTTVKGPTSMPTNWNQSTTVVEADDQIVDWVPPATQSGDGSTALNERLGY